MSVSLHHSFDSGCMGLFVEVNSKERHVALKVYDQHGEKVRETIAFLRCSQGPPELYHNMRSLTKLSNSTAAPLSSVTEPK